MVFIRYELHLLKAKDKHAIRAKYLQLLTSITPQIFLIFRYQCRLSRVLTSGLLPSHVLLSILQ